MNKHILFSILSLLLVFGIVQAAIDVDTAKTEGVFATQDLVETDFDAQEFDATFTSVEIANEKIYVKYTIPAISQSGSDYKIIQDEKLHSISLDTYNDCRNGGDDKETCVAELKTFIKNTSDSYKESNREIAKTLQVIEAKSDYTGELSVEDLGLSTEFLNE